MSWEVTWEFSPSSTDIILDPENIHTHARTAQSEMISTNFRGMENFENNRLTNDEDGDGGNGSAENQTKIFYEFALECLCVDAMCTDANALNQFPILARTHPHTHFT